MTQIVSSISGIEVWAPSAGSASRAMYDKNSRDLSKCVDAQSASAIASAYQVVSATATQLYAGTSFLTSVNTAPISASRAGQAANASMANSAYYDGTGRLISALPDSATVSAIASGYASSKADASSLSSYALSADVSSTIDTVSSNSASWGQGGVDSATVSSIASSYAQSAASGVTDTVSSNSATWAQGLQYGDKVTNGVNTIGLGKSANANTDAGLYLTSTHGAGFYKVNEMMLNRSNYGETVNFNLGSAGSQVNIYASGTRAAWLSAWNGNTTAALVATGSDAVLALGSESAYGSSISAWDDCYDTVSANSASWGGGATGDYVEKSSLNTTIGSSNNAFGLGLAHGISASAGNRGYAFGQDISANDDSLACGSACTAVYGSFAHGTHASAYLESFADGWYVTARNSATAFGQFNRRGNGSTALETGSAAFAIGDGTSELSRHDLMLVTKNGEITMFSSTADTTGTGIMSSLRSKADSSALSSYALSADVSGTVSTVASQSANWGGSALALSAGPGVKLELSGNTLVASTDETVLWEGAGTSSCTLSENCTNFERIKILYGLSGGTSIGDGRWIETYPGVKYLDFTRAKGVSNVHITWVSMSVQPTTITVSATRTMSFGPYTATAWSDPTISVNNGEDRNAMYKVVGINRTAEA